MLFVRIGRDAGEFTGVEEESVFVLPVLGCVAEGGWLTGWLETVLRTLWRSWAAPADTKPNITNIAHTDRYEIFFKFFKT